MIGGALSWALPGTQDKLSLALRLGYLHQEKHQEVASLAAQTAKTLNALVRSLRRRA